MQFAVDLAERGRIPEAMIRFGIRRLVASRLSAELRGSQESRADRFQRRLTALRDSAVALSTDTANRQHYEVPAEFFRVVLGRHLKYSSGLWGESTVDLDQAEADMLEMYAQRAGLRDGQRVLDLGCGWGSFSLWAAARFPASKIVAVSNSSSQRDFIVAQTERRGLDNITVVTADVNALDFPGERFDRVISIEMFEHVRNYATLLNRISRWLKRDGRLFVHIFCHRQLMYPYESAGADNWMGRYFFTDGLMPSADTLAHFNQDMRIDAQWSLPGTHYQRTAAAWLERLDTHREAVRAALEPVYDLETQVWIQRWRLFFMACEELFGYRDGREWQLGHYLMSRVRAP